MLESSIDLGTNTCLLLIARTEESGDASAPRRVTETLEDHSTIVRLGQGVDRARELQPEAMERTLKCLRGYAERVRSAGLNPGATVCVATSQARDARNGAAFFATIEKETGFRFRIIPGEEEARLTFLGALLPGMDPEGCATIDIGGGSTEITGLGGGLSVDIGSVRYTERFLKSDPVTDEEFWACQESVDRELEKFRSWRAGEGSGAELVAVAGTATTLAAWHLGLERFDARRLDGCTLTRGDLHRMVEELKWRTIEERRGLPAMEAARADVILAGAIILWRAHEVLGFSECRISTRGLRYGTLMAGLGAP